MNLWGRVSHTKPKVCIFLTNLGIFYIFLTTLIFADLKNILFLMSLFILGYRFGKIN